MSTICDDLRAAILQAAVQGKLTERLPDDDSIEEVFARIEAKKKELVSEGKIKKQKALARITDKEASFSIPEGWRWARLGEVFNVHSSIRIHQSDWKSDGVPFFRGRELVKLARDGDVQAEIFISQELYEQNKDKGGVPQKDDILVSAVGTIGRVYVVKGTKPFYYKDAYVLCLDNVGNLNPYFIKRAIESPLVQDVIMNGAMGTTVAQLTIEKAKNLLIPIPSLAEQKRIVEKVDELMARVADLEKSADALASLKKAFPSDIKAALLQAAMQGKLTKQLSEDGDALDLLEQIKTEKEKLVAEGKIRKQKALAPIVEDEIPFDIPENWQWARLGDLTEPCEYPYADGPFGSNLKKEHYTSRHEVRIIQLSNIGEGGWKDKNVKYTTYEHLKTIERSEANSGDIVIAKMMPAGRAMIVPDIEECYVLSSDAVKIVPNRHIDTRYLERFLNSPIFQRQVYSNVQGITRVRTSLGKLIGYLVAVPPLAEQKRIVERLDALMQNIEVVGDLITAGE